MKTNSERDATQPVPKSTMRKTPMRKTLLAGAAGALLGVGLVAALAQAGGGPAGMAGGPFELMIPKMLARAKMALNLNAQQQQTWDSIVAQGRSARQTAYANRQQIKAALATELAKPEPDLAAVAAIADNVEQQNRTLRTGVRDQWLQLYATFTPEQKGVVRDLLQKRQQRLAAMAAKMRSHFQAMHPPAN